MGFRCLYPACVMAYLLMWLTLITITTGMCLMNVYEFVKVRPAPQSFRDKRRNRRIRIFLFPPVSSLKRYFSTHYLKIFFKFTVSKTIIFYISFYTFSQFTSRYINERLLDFPRIVFITILTFKITICCHI